MNKLTHLIPPLLLLVPITAAQLSYDSRTQNYRCAIPNAAYCAGSSNTTNIIVRCEGTVGHPANCDDNLAGYAPIGVSYSPCIQSSEMEGDAACSKEGKIYRDSGAPSGGANSPALTYVSYSTKPLPAVKTPSITPIVSPHTHPSYPMSTTVSNPNASTTSSASATSASVSYLAPNTTSSQPPSYTGGAASLTCFSANGALFAAFSLASLGGLIAGAAL